MCGCKYAFKSDSTRGAVFIAAFKSTYISKDLKTVGWKNESFFVKFYYCPIASDCVKAVFAKSVFNLKPVSALHYEYTKMTECINLTRITCSC